MKRLNLIVIMLFTLVSFSFGQKESKIKNFDDDSFNCNDYVSTIIITDTTIVVAANESIIISKDSKKGIGFYIFKSDNNLVPYMEVDDWEIIIFNMKVVGAGNCIDKNNKMYVLFRDGTNIQLTNDSDSNCDAKYKQYFGGPFGRIKELETLKTKEIESIKISTSNGYIKEYLKPEQSKKILYTLNCLLNN